MVTLPRSIQEICKVSGELGFTVLALSAAFCALILVSLSLLRIENGVPYKAHVLHIRWSVGFELTEPERPFQLATEVRGMLRSLVFMHDMTSMNRKSQHD